MSSFRRPIPPVPIEPFDLPHPAVPAGLAGLRILHITDLHTRRFAPRSERFRCIRDALAQTPAHLILLTGDYMDDPGQEIAAMRTLETLAAAWPTPPLGAYAIFGNHDSPDFRRTVLRAGLPIRFLGGQVVDVPILSSLIPRPSSLRLIGLDWPEDFVSTLCGELEPPTADSLRFVLAHYPTAIFAAADFGVPLVFAGHTHAGQMRLSPRFAPHTSSDVPVHLASGVLRLRSTLCCISRGLGEGVVERLRFNCPPQIPLYTLRRAALPPLQREGDAKMVTQAVAW